MRAEPFQLPRTVDQLRELQVSTTELAKAHQAALAKRKHEALHGPSSAKHDDAWYLQQAEKPSDATEQKYLRRGAQLMSDALGQRKSVWDVLEARSGSSGSWYAGRAALQFYLLQEVRTEKQRVDRWFRDQRSVDGKTLRQTIERLVRLANDLAEIPTQRPARFGSLGHAKRVRHSKAASIRSAPNDWRERVAAAMPKNLRMFWLVQCVTGCRPSELQKGFGVMRRLDGNLQVSVNGAKVGKRSGQPLRKMILAADSGPARMLAESLKPGVPHEEVRLTKRTERSDHAVDAYRRRVSRYCRKVFPGATSAEGLSAYSARHQFKADLKHQGISRIDLAAAMGHRTTRSAVYYGSGGRAGGGAVKPRLVKATHAAKVRPSVASKTLAKKSLTNLRTRKLRRT